MFPLGQASGKTIYFDQVAGGTDFVQQSLDAFRVPTVKHTILVDMFGYDACPAFTAMEEFLYCL